MWWSNSKGLIKETKLYRFIDVRVVFQVFSVKNIELIDRIYRLSLQIKSNYVKSNNPCSYIIVMPHERHVYILDPTNKI